MEELFKDLEVSDLTMFMLIRQGVAELKVEQERLKLSYEVAELLENQRRMDDVTRALENNLKAQKYLKAKGSKMVDDGKVKPSEVLRVEQSMEEQES